MFENIILQFKSEFSKADKDVSKLGNNLKSLGNTTNVVKNTFSGANKNLNRFRGTLRNINLDANRTSKSLSMLSKSTSSFTKVVGAVSIYKLAQVMASSIQSTLDMIETANLFSVAMGDVAEETDKAMVSISKATGLDLNSLREATATYSLLARSMGFTTEQAKNLSKGTTQLALDLSSLVNVPVQQVFADLKSGLVGQTETVYKYGVDLTEAGLQQTALSKGISQTTRTMTQGEKMWLRYETLLNSTILAQGDLAKTIEQPANQLRILGERLVTLGRTIGGVFLKSLGDILPYLNAIVQVITAIFSMIGKLAGYKPPKIENTAGAIGGIGDSAEDSADKVGKLSKKLKDVTLGFDELNTLTKEQAGGKGAGIGIGMGEIGEVSEYDGLLSKIKQKSDEIKDAMLKWLGVTQTIDSETGEIVYKLDDGYTRLEKIRDLIIGIISLLTFNKLRTLIYKYLPLILRSLSDISGFMKLISEYGVAKTLTDLFGQKILWAGTIGLVAYHFYNLWQSSENFRKGIKLIGEIFDETWKKIRDDYLKPMLDDFIKIGKAVLNILPEPVKQAIVKALEIIKEIVGKVDLKFSDLLLTIGGFILLGTPQGTFMLIAEAISLAIRAIGTNADESGKDIKNKFSKVIDESIKNSSITATENFDSMKKGFSELQTAISDKTILMTDDFSTMETDLKTHLTNAGTEISKWWIEKVSPWFTLEKWQGLWDNVKSAFETKWTEIKNWWNNTAIVRWFEDDVKKWFKLKTWLDVLSGMSEGFETTWKNGLNSVIELVNKFIRWLNEKMVFEWDAFEIGGKELVPAGSIKLFEVPEITTRLARGGMLENGMPFIAGENGKAELLGSHSGKTTVMPLENTDFVNAIYDAVYSAISNAQNGGQIIENVLTLDGEIIYKNQQKISAKKGIDFGSPLFNR